MKRLLSVLSVFVLATSLAVAAPAKKAEVKEKVAKSTYENFDKKFAKVKKGLNLTAQQNEKIAELDAKLKKDQKALKSQISKEKTVKADALSKKNYEAAKNSEEAIAKLEASSKAIQIDYMQSVSNVLDKEQNQKLDEMLKDAVKKPKKK